VNEKKIITDLLDQIDLKYPPQRIRKAEIKWRNLWDPKETFRFPPLAIARNAAIQGTRHHAHHSAEEKFFTLKQQLTDILAKADIQDDYIPSLLLNIGAYIIGDCFGGNFIYQGGMYIFEPFINSAEDLDRLPEFNPQGKNTLMSRALEMLEYMLEMTDERIKIVIHTPQGLLESLSVMCASGEFYIAMAETPEKVLAAIKKIKCAYEYYIEKQLEITGTTGLTNFAMGYSYRPRGTGIGVGEDIMATISPDDFRPYLHLYEEISAKFGGLLLHSCGQTFHQIENICNTPAIKAVHFSQVRPHEYFHRITRPLIIISQNDWEDFNHFTEYARAVKAYGFRTAFQIETLSHFMYADDKIKSEGSLLGWESYHIKKVAGMTEQVKKILEDVFIGP